MRLSSQAIDRRCSITASSDSQGESLDITGEGMTERRCGDWVGYGLSKILRQVE